VIVWGRMLAQLLEASVGHCLIERSPILD
jgi:hypothetical protein